MRVSCSSCVARQVIPSVLTLLMASELLSYAVIQPEPVISVDFDGGDELSTLFNTQYYEAYGHSGLLTQVAAGGIGDSGAIDISDQTYPSAAIYNASSLGFSQVGSAISASVFVLFKEPTPLRPDYSYSNPLLRLGFVEDPSDGFSFTTHDMNAEIKSRGDGTIHLVLTVGASGVLPAQELPLVVGHWYRLSASFENLGASFVRMRAEVDDFGLTGATLAGQVSAFDYTFQDNAGLVNDSSLWPGFETSEIAGADLVDQFSFIPEPTALSLISLSWLALMMGRRRG